MTVQNSNVKNIYIGNGSTTSFPFTFPCPKADYIKVFVRKNNLIAQTDDFTVDLDNATVTYPKSGTPLAAGETLVILRELPLEQPLNLVNQGPFFAEDIETTFDEEVMMIQQLREELSRSLTVPVDIDGETYFNTSIPIEAGKSFRVKDDGTGFEVTTDPGKVIDEANALHTQIKKDAGALLEQTKVEANKAVDAKDGAVKALKNATDKATEAAESLKLIQKHKALWYDNIAAMKADVSIKVGSYACTAGYYKANDGGGGSYIIRAKTVEDVEDGGSIHFLQKDLVAELIVENGTVNVKQFGARGDGERDDGSSINKSFEYCYLKAYDCYIPYGAYLTKKPLIFYGADGATSKSVRLSGSNKSNTKIFTDVAMDALLIIRGYGADNKPATNVSIKNIYVEGNDNVNYLIHCPNSLIHSCFENIRMYGSKLAGFKTRNNTYLCSFVNLKCNRTSVAYDFYDATVTNTSCRFADCYCANVEIAYKISGQYMTLINCCAEGVTEKVFDLRMSGSLINCGSEAVDAKYMFYCERCTLTIINPSTWGNFNNPDATHIYALTSSNINIIGGYLLQYMSKDAGKVVPGRLYQLAQDSSITFTDVNIVAEYAKDNSYNEDVKNFVNINQKYGGAKLRGNTKIAYIGQDNRFAKNKQLFNQSKDANNPVVANAIFFGLGDAQAIRHDGYDLQWGSSLNLGDILLSRKPKEIGGIGWVQAKDVNDGSVSNPRWTDGEFLKIPVISGGITTERPSKALVIGQCYFDTSLGKPIWYKGSSVWVDAIGTNV